MVVFNPSQVGPRTATLTLTDATSGISKAITLRGVGVAMAPAATPNPLVFGNLNVGSVSTQNMTINAYGDDPVNFVFQGLGNNFVVSTGSCAVQTPCSVGVTFQPQSAGSFNGTIIATDPYSKASTSFNLSGKAGAAMTSLSATSLVYAARDEGTTSIAQTVTITNAGNIALSISGITLNGANTGDFPIETNTCTAKAMQPGASCAVSISFAPTASGARSANMVIMSNAPSSPDIVQLSGTGN
jgi:trimeric autotransporter adhesin